MEAKFVTGRDDEFPLDFYTSIFVRDAALVCATLSEGEGGNDLDWNKMSQSTALQQVQDFFNL